MKRTAKRIAVKKQTAKYKKIDINVKINSPLISAGCLYF